MYNPFSWAPVKNPRKVRVLRNSSQTSQTSLHYNPFATSPKDPQTFWPGEIPRGLDSVHGITFLHNFGEEGKSRNTFTYVADISRDISGSWQQDNTDFSVKFIKLLRIKRRRLSKHRETMKRYRNHQTHYPWKWFRTHYTYLSTKNYSSTFLSRIRKPL